MTFTNVDSCTTNAQCEALYQCVNQICMHKELFPPETSEIIGIVLMALLSGLASLAGIGGGGIMVSLMVAFFNYNQKKAVLLIFIPIFGAAFGNFLNLVRQVDPISKTPIVNIKLAILACPMMALGSLIGVILNKFLPAFFLVCVLLYFLRLSLLKFLALSRRDYYIENDRIQKLYQSLNEIREIEMDIISRDSVLPNDQFLKEGNQGANYAQVFMMVVVILSTFLTIFFLRGSKDLKSILHIEYCGGIYWFLNIILAVLCFIFFKINIKLFLDIRQVRKIQQSKFNDPTIVAGPTSIERFIFFQSLKAGIISGFGLGGGMFLIPLYSTLGLSSIQATGTSSFNIFMTSFLTMMQVIALGMIPINSAIQLILVMILGTYISSSLIFTVLQKYDRLSYIMWSLVVFTIYAMIMLVIQFNQQWSKQGYQFEELIHFSEFC